MLRFSLPILAAFLVPSSQAYQDNNQLSLSESISTDPGLDPIRVEISESNTEAVEAAAAKALMGGLLGRPTITDSSTDASYLPVRTYFDPKGTAHVRLAIQTDGYEIEGAAMSIHIEKDGNIAGYNGEAFEGDTDGMPKDRLPSAVALEDAAEQAGLQGEWLDSPYLTAVMARKTKSLCWAWKQTLFYETADEKTGALLPHKDDVYADVTTGKVSAESQRAKNFHMS